MPFRQLPNSDISRIQALDAALAKWTSTSDPTKRLITTTHFNQLEPEGALRGNFKGEVSSLGTALSSQAEQTSAFDLAAAALEQIVSHFIQVFNLAVQRGVFQRSDRAFYSLDINRSDVPPLSTHADRELWAARILAGEGARVADGGAPMAMPSVGEVESFLGLFRAQQTTQTAAKDVYDSGQENVAALRPEVDALIRDMWDTIEFNLRTLPGPSKRRRAREWGVVYVPRPGEPPDPEEGDDTPPGGSGG